MKTITVSNLDDSIEDHKSKGYRLDMIKPADEPREALLSKNDETICLILNSDSTTTGSSEISESKIPNTENGLAKIDQQNWIRGRAGMEYRDLVPGRLDGKVKASHIRLTKGGEVPDYVHYHKIDFQMIYCKQGRIRVVYEDQGPPFWMETGDCVLQPPEIRHRVLECTAGAEVIEVSMPTEHETWVEHEIQLPTANINRDRNFAGQKFHRYRSSKNSPGGYTEHSLGILEASNGRCSARIIKSDTDPTEIVRRFTIDTTHFFYVLRGSVQVEDRDELSTLNLGESHVVFGGSIRRLVVNPDSELLCLSF